MVSIACMAVVAAVLRWVDLVPHVEADFFFAPDDPQLRASQEVARQFPGSGLVVIRVEGDTVVSAAYRGLIDQMTAALREAGGVRGINSISTERNAAASPLWGPTLLNPGARSSNILLQVGDIDPAVLVDDLEARLQPFESDGVTIQVSGIPYVVELIRRSLLRDLIVFSSAALILFGLIIGVVYRRAWLIVGTLGCCLLAICMTVVLASTFSIGIGLLTANIAVIVFVLTLSHTVFLTANWRRGAADGAVDPTAFARRETIGPSFWAMLTTLLGFLSLLLATAKPLRELGMAGALGALTALAVAYGVFPIFLRAERPPTVGPTFLVRFGIARRRWTIGATALVVVLAGFGFGRLSTDPTLLSYFDPDGRLYAGLAAIDLDGGSSPLDVVVRDPAGATVDGADVVARMTRLQEALEADPAVGGIVSPVLLLGEARRAPLAGLLPNSVLLELLQGPLFGQVGLAYVTADRTYGRFFLRMREGGRTEPRAVAIARVERNVRDAGLEPFLIAGQYELQLQLGRLIGSSLAIGLGGLLVLFVGIAAIVSRDGVTTGIMVACLASIPIVVLGVMGHLSMPVDIIASPAANVALAMGVDSMIHLVMRVRSLKRNHMFELETWVRARYQLLPPILGAAGIISVGFGIFGLSSFPPTQRFGIAVIIGTLAAAAMTLLVLPAAATAVDRRS